jgi:hypothetical protein
MPNIVLLSCLEMRMWRKEVISRKQLYINEEVAYKKILMCSNKSLIIYLSRYTELNMWFNKVTGK